MSASFLQNFSIQKSSTRRCDHILLMVFGCGIFIDSNMLLLFLFRRVWRLDIGWCWDGLLLLILHVFFLLSCVQGKSRHFVLKSSCYESVYTRITTCMDRLAQVHVYSKVSNMKSYRVISYNNNENDMNNQLVKLNQNASLNSHGT